MTEFEMKMKAAQKAVGLGKLSRRDFMSFAIASGITIPAASMMFASAARSEAKKGGIIVPPKPISVNNVAVGTLQEVDPSDGDKVSVTAERIAKAPKLKMIVTAGIGSDHTDLQAAMGRGITVAEGLGEPGRDAVGDGDHERHGVGGGELAVEVGGDEHHHRRTPRHVARGASRGS